MVRKTHNQFVIDLASANPSVTPIGTYVLSKEPIEVECRRCGYHWASTPNMLLRGSGCPECARQHKGEGRRKTNEQFLRELESANPTAEPLEEYINSTTAISVRCKTCRTEWMATPASLLKGVLCPKCCHERKKRTRRKSNDEFLSEMREKHPEIEVLGVYSGSKVGVDCKCLKCGFEWSPRPNDLLGGHGCPKCGKSHYKTHEEYVEELGTRFPSLEVIGRYRGDGKEIRVRCRTCGHERKAIANSLLRQQEGGSNCPSCAGLKRHTQEEFESRLKEISPDIRVIGEYRNANTKIEVECGRCGHKWCATPASLIHAKSGCPSCYHGSTSVMEQFIYWSLVHALGEDEVLSRDKSLGFELDVYVPSLGLAIEPGSWYWHKKKLSEDENKRLVCAKAAVRLVIIYDQCPLKDPPFEDDCFIYARPLAVEKDLVELKSIVVSLLKDYGIDYEFSKDEWNEIEKKARKSSKRMTTKEFKAKLAEISPSIEVLSDFVGSGVRIHCRCRDCGNEWSTVAGNLLYQGTKCPSCTYRRKAIDKVPSTMASAEFKRELSEVSPALEILEDVDSVTDRVNVRCYVCGHEWTALPRVLLAGSGCPICDDVFRSIERNGRNPENLERKHKAFVSELASVTDNIVLVGDPRKFGKLVTARCTECGHEWRTRPMRLLEHHTCPHCEKKGNKSRLKTDEQFRAEAIEKNPEIEIMGKYRGVNQPIQVRCSRCGRQWESTPGRVLQGIGCGPCNMRGPRKTTQQYREELSAVNDRIRLKGEYKGATKKVRIECLECGHEWETAAAHLLSGTGCPKCAKKKIGAAQRKSHMQFVTEITVKSPTVEVVGGNYERKSSRIKCRCKICGHKWETSGQSLLQGSGCPACASKMSSIRQKGIPVKKRMRPVRCVETGEDYTSATAASHAYGLSDSCVNQAVKRGGTAAGFHWVYADGC